MNENPNSITVARNELYEQLWSTPILRLARRYGVPYTELVKICERHQIPRPPQGFWSRIHAGRKIDRTLLPEINSLDPISIVQKPSKKPGNISADRTSKECTACREYKLLNDFYKKGSRFDSRCKGCTCLIKAESRRRALGVQSEKELLELGEQRRTSEGYPRVELIDGKIVIVDRIYFPMPRRRVKPEQILELYHENLSIADIAKSVGWTPKTIVQALNRFGIRIGRKDTARRLSSDVPYGWKICESRLLPHLGEQWIIEKIEDDLKLNKNAEQIVRCLNSARIRFRYGKSWSPDSIEAVLKKNRRLTQILCKPSSLSKPAPALETSPVV